MIKVGVAGADSRQAGELIRILIHHPEVELVSLLASEVAGKEISSHHHGLIGEKLPPFTERLDPELIDVLFLCTKESLQLLALPEIGDSTSLRIIDLTGLSRGLPGFVCGISELFRKPLVRGAKRAFIPSPPAVVAMIGFFPAATHLLLNSTLKISCSVPDGIDVSTATDEFNEAITAAQQSFAGIGEIIVDRSPNNDRGIFLKGEMETSVAVSDIVSLYENMYEDHNFTFISSVSPKMADAIGTEKCIIRISRDAADKVVIEVVADARLRGAAGDGVHAMNLLFGLHERTGLVFKASEF